MLQGAARAARVVLLDPEARDLARGPVILNSLVMQAEGLDFLGLETVQAIHGLGHVLLEQDVGGAQGFVQRGLDQTLLTAGRLGQHEAGDQLLGARMADAKAQPEEVIVVAHPGDDVLEAVMAAVTAPLLELGDAGRQVQLVVGHQDLLRGDLVEARERRHGLAGEIHVGVRDKQPHILPVHQEAGGVAEELGLFAQADIVPACQLLHIPGARIMAGLGIFGAGITQPDNQFDLTCHA